MVLIAIGPWFRASRARALAATLGVLLMLGLQIPAARAAVTASSGDNIQSGDNTSHTSQDGNAGSGDAISGGQVIAAVAGPGGRVEITADNVATDASAQS